MKTIYNFLEDFQGNKSSKRLLGVPCGFFAMALSILFAAANVFTSVNNPKWTVITIGILFAASLFYLGIATFETIVNILKRVKK